MRLLFSVVWGQSSCDSHMCQGVPVVEFEHRHRSLIGVSGGSGGLNRDGLYTPENPLIRNIACPANGQ